MRLCLFSCVLLLSVSSFAGATVIDFSNLGTLSSTKTVTVDDVTITFSRPAAS